MAGLGYVTAAVQLGVQALTVRPKRSIGPFQAQVTLEETHIDELVITDHPVETGARITDHAYMRPSEVIIRCSWSNSPSNSSLLGGLVGALTGTLAGLSSILSGNSASQVKAVYNNLVALQKSRIPFDIETGKRNYSNMLVKSLRANTDKESENILDLTVICQQILIVSTQVVTVSAPKEAQKDPGSTMSTLQKGVKSLVPPQALNLAAAAQSFPVTQSIVNGVPLP